MESILSLEGYLRIVLPAPPGMINPQKCSHHHYIITSSGDQDWQSLRKAVERLRPVATATEDVEQDKATITTVLQYVTNAV